MLRCMRVMVTDMRAPFYVVDKWQRFMFYYDLWLIDKPSIAFDRY